jgi:hypothetical protein
VAKKKPNPSAKADLAQRATLGEKRFWDIIARACPPDGSSDEWFSALRQELLQLSPDEIVHFDWLFQSRLGEACTIDLWGAAYLINGGASDDGFYYFRSWLVGMGQRVYRAALKDPDSLADVVNPDEEYESDIHVVAHRAWEEVTGQRETADMDNAWLGPYPAADELKGEDWDFDDDAEMRRRLPRLAAMYLEDDE